MPAEAKIAAAPAPIAPFAPRTTIFLIGRIEAQYSASGVPAETMKVVRLTISQTVRSRSPSVRRSERDSKSNLR
jgi:hypothetical protein